MNLYKHQQALLDLNPKKWGLWWHCGTGKTIGSIAIAKKNSPNSTLVICIKSDKEKWEEEVKPLGWPVYTKEEFRKNWNTIPFYDCVIGDEGHYFSGPKSQMHKNLIKYIKKHDPAYIYLLTATPYLSTPWNIFALGRILGYKWNYMQFKLRFFKNEYYGNRTVSVPKDDIEKDIATMVSSIGTTVALQDCIDVPEQIYQTELFDLTMAQKQAIKVVNETETVHIVKWTKIHQIMGGSLKGDGYVKDQFFKCDKLARLKEICSEHKKVVVVCRYNAECEMIREQIGGFIINGVTQDRHHKIVFANQKSQGHLIINAACSEGYELPTFDLMIFYSYDFSLKNYIQMKGRIQRINHVKKNVYLSLINKGTIDEDVKKSLDKKINFDLEIYGK